MKSANEIIDRPVKQVTSASEDVSIYQKKLLGMAKRFTEERMNSNEFGELEIDENLYATDLVLVQKFVNYPEDNIGDLNQYMILFHHIYFPKEDFFKWLHSFGWHLYEDLEPDADGSIGGVVGISSFSYVKN